MQRGSISSPNRLSSQHRVDGRRLRQPFLRHAERDEDRQREDEEVPRPHAGIEHGDVLRRLRPAFERAGGRTPGAFRPVLRLVSDEAQIGPVDIADLAGGAQRSLVRRRRREARVAGKHLAGPPGAERVVQQEEDHVVLGEELRDGRQLVGADLHLGLVDLVLLVRLPELVDPAEAVIGLEHRASAAPSAGPPSRTAFPAAARSASTGSSLRKICGSIRSA